MLPESIVATLLAHLVKVKALHEEDLAAGLGEVYLPFALDKKYPNAGQAQQEPQQVNDKSPRRTRLCRDQTTVGFTKVRYCGLAKNAGCAFTALALAIFTWLKIN